MPHLPNRAGHETGPNSPASLARHGLTLAAVVLLVLALAAACGGSDDDADDNRPEVVKSTFTPTPPDFTPEAVQTQSARGTAFMQTSTAQTNASPTAPSVEGTPAEGTPRATIRVGEIRPPDAILRTPGGEIAGAIGDSNFVDPATGTGASIDAPYVPLPGGAVSWASDAPATVDVPDSPYPVQSAAVEIYTYDENVARPTKPDGTPTGELAFFPQTSPAQQVPIAGASITMTPDVEPGNYIVSVRIVWQVAPEIILQTGEQFTQYIYVVRVG